MHEVKWAMDPTEVLYLPTAWSRQLGCLLYVAFGPFLLSNFDQLGRKEGKDVGARRVGHLQD